MVNCQNIFFSNENMYILFFFFGNSDRDFYSENNNASQVYTYITKIQKKVLKNATIVYALHFALNIGGIFVQSLCYYIGICYLFFQLP
jgi:hypothetical protein